MTKLQRKTLLLTKYFDEGVPDSTIFRVVQNEVDLNSLISSVQEGGILIQQLVASADPYLRYSIKSAGGIKLGTPMHCFVAGRVLASKHPNWAEGDLIGTHLPLMTIQEVDPAFLASTLSWKLTGLIKEEQIS
jgi:NADPH-dependent curcumin reductase CurA